MIHVRNKKQYVVCEALTALVMKSTIFWDITLCGPLKVNQHFEGTCRLHLQGRIISKQGLLATCFQAGSLLGLFSSTLKMEATCSIEAISDGSQVLH
jgi:hypothetical protein